MYISSLNILDATEKNLSFGKYSLPFEYSRWLFLLLFKNSLIIPPTKLSRRYNSKNTMIHTNLLKECMSQNKLSQHLHGCTFIRITRLLTVILDYSFLIHFRWWSSRHSKALVPTGKNFCWCFLHLYYFVRRKGFTWEWWEEIFVFVALITSVALFVWLNK